MVQLIACCMFEENRAYVWLPCIKIVSASSQARLFLENYALGKLIDLYVPTIRTVTDILGAMSESQGLFGWAMAVKKTVVGCEL